LPVPFSTSFLLGLCVTNNKGTVSVPRDLRTFVANFEIPGH